MSRVEPENKGQRPWMLASGAQDLLSLPAGFSPGPCLANMRGEHKGTLPQRAGLLAACTLAGVCLPEQRPPLPSSCSKRLLVPCPSLSDTQRKEGSHLTCGRKEALP